MAKQVTTLTIFVSAPSNLNAERLVIGKVCQELSKELGAEKDINLQVLLWDEDVIPGVGSDPQNVINSQLEYDIYIGLLSTVFGTTTPRAESGTEEEFRNAYDKYMNAPEKIRVLFYFKKTSTDVFSIELDQLERVHNFRKQLGPLGVLYHDFQDVDQLRDDIRLHLRGLVLKQWSGSSWRVLSPPSAKTNIFFSAVEDCVVQEADFPKIELLEPASLNDERAGLLEVIIEGMSTGKRFQSHMERVTELTGKVTQALVDAGNAIEAASHSEDVSQTKEIIDQTAEMLDEFTAGMRTELFVYQEVSMSTILMLERIANLFFEEKTGSLDQLLMITNTFDELTKSLSNVRSGIQQFHVTIEKTPSMTMRFRASRKRLSAALDEYISSYTVFIGTANTLIEEVRGRLSDIKA